MQLNGGMTCAFVMCVHNDHNKEFKMRYMKRAQIYKASNGNVTFDPQNIKAFSYGWWKFVGIVEDKVVFNNYRYSPTTAKHQSKVRTLMSELNIKIDLELPVPCGLQKVLNISEAILIAEEHLCDKFLIEMLKRQDNYQRAKARKLKAKLTDYLENEVAFRDYDITSRKYFENPGYTIASKVAIHQVVDALTLEADVKNALYNFHRDGFSSIVFYIEGL